MALYKSGDKAAQNTSAATPALPRVRPDQSIKQNRPPVNSAIKGWYWIWLVFVLVRLVACLMKHN